MRGKRVWQEKQCQSLGSGGRRCSRYRRFSGLDEFRLGVFSSENEASEEISRLQGWKMDCTGALGQDLLCYRAGRKRDFKK